jgi:hypothetical protein
MNPKFVKQLIAQGESATIEFKEEGLWCINRPLLGANGETSPILDFQPGYEFPGVLSQVTA